MQSVGVKYRDTPYMVVGPEVLEGIENWPPEQNFSSKVSKEGLTEVKKIAFERKDGNDMLNYTLVAVTCMSELQYSSDITNIIDVKRYNSNKDCVP